MALALSVAEPVRGHQTTDCRKVTYLDEQYYEGLPYVAARDAGTRCWREFVHVVRDTTMRARWVNAIVAIGAAAAPGAEQELVRFARAQSGRLSPSTCRAVKAVPVALAYHANHDTSSHGRAIDALRRWALAEDTIRWHCDYHRSPAEARAELSVLALLSLGLSGRSDADSIIEQVARKAPPDTSLMREARRIRMRVAALGLQGYYMEESARRADRARPGRKTP